MKRPYGMAPTTFSAYVLACFRAGINPVRVMQTIGNAPASAGTHAKDGSIIIAGISYDYCAAFDIRSKDLNETQITQLLSQCYRVGIVGWHRTRIEGFSAEHMHLIDVNLHMKESLRSQVYAWMDNKNGLANNAFEPHASCDIRTYDMIKADFNASNRI